MASNFGPRTSDSGLSFTRRDLWAMGGLVASMVGMFWKVIFTSQMFFYRDVSNYTYPTTQLIRETVRHGSLPYWNPYLNYGQPILANPNLLFFYPYTLALILFPFDLAYTLHFVLHFALAAVGTYLLARKWGQSYLAAFFAAYVFAFSGQILSLGNVYNTAACTAWIPWALLATERALESRRLRSWVLVIVAFSLQWLAAEPLTFMGTFCLCFAYAFYRSGRRDRLWSKANFRLVAAFVLVGCLTLLLCAVQLLPASDLLSNSRRGRGLRFSETSHWSVHPLSLLNIVIPDFAGPILGAPTGWGWLMSDQMGPYNPSDFLGFVPFFFALAGWAAGKERRRHFVAGAAVILLLLSFGHYTPVFSLAYLLLPPLALVRFPIKLLVHFVLLLAILAGWGFDALRSVAPGFSPASGAGLKAGATWKAPPKGLMLPLKIALACVLFVGASAWLAPTLIASPVRWAVHAFSNSTYRVAEIPDFLVGMVRLHFPGLAGFLLGWIVLLVGLSQGKKWARPGVYALALVGMVQFMMVNSKANPTVPKTYYTYRSPVLAEFKAGPGTFRYMSFSSPPTTAEPQNLQTYVNFESIPEARDLSEVTQGAFQARLELAGGAMLNEVDGSINIDQERAQPYYLYDLNYYVRFTNDPTRVDCLLGRTNVKYVIRPKRVDSAAARFVGDIFNGSPKPDHLYEDLCFTPRAYVAGDSLFSTDPDETLNHLASPDFDALHTVILDAPAGSTPELAAGFSGVSPVASIDNRQSAINNPAPAGQVEIVHRGPNSVTLHAQLTRPGYVVLLDRYDPNWHATVDGQPTSVLRANQIFRAVYVEPGRHEIRFKYHQRDLRLGLAVSLVTTMTLIVLSVWKIEI